MRALITGASGFVGQWLQRHLRAEGDSVHVLPDGVDIAGPDEVSAFVAQAAPEVIYHLAAFTHVGQSWEHPSEAFRVNVLGTVELLEAARRLSRLPRIILVSSSEVYGRGRGEALTESSPFEPVTPYAASKVAAETVGLQAFLGRGLEVIRARPFNHIGPGQSEAFVVAGLAKRVASAERDATRSIAVGNLSSRRDFTDVRDVVRAYRALAIYGVPGEAYNICSGTATSIQVLLEGLLSRSKYEIAVETDPALVRAVDVPILFGSYEQIERLCGWRPKIPLEQTLDEVLESWRLGPL